MNARSLTEFSDLGKAPLFNSDGYPAGCLGVFGCLETKVSNAGGAKGWKGRGYICVRNVTYGFRYGCDKKQEKLVGSRSDIAADVDVWWLDSAARRLEKS